jgi:hypothetical protein
MEVICGNSSLGWEFSNFLIEFSTGISLASADKCPPIYLSLPSYFSQTLSCINHGKYEIGFPWKDKPGRILNFAVCSGKFVPRMKSIGTMITVGMICGSKAPELLNV